MGQTISTTNFYLFGRKHCTQTGYLLHLKNYASPAQTSATILPGQEGDDGVRMDGKVIVITGANSGIGKELATYVAAKGAKLYMLCRSAGRAEEAKEEIIQLTSNENVKVLLADVGELSQVRKVADEIKLLETKIDCLVCNAGVLLNERQVSSEGLEATLASHLIGGSYLLPKLLLPLLEQSEDPRVIFVSSGGMYNTKFPSWDVAMSTADPSKYNGNMAYAYAKRGQVLLAQRWTRDFPKIVWLSAHPGWAATLAVDAAYGDQKKYLEPMRSTWQGAEGIAWLMSTERTNLQSGAFYLDREPQRKHLAGAFFSEGTFTKNTDQEVDDMMEHLKEVAGI